MRVITSERAWRGEESENAEILLRFGTHTLRAQMMKDVYSDQGRYELDRWNGSEWKQVVSLPSQVGYELVGRVCGAPVPADFRAVLDLLMADAEMVLAAPQGGLDTMVKIWTVIVSFRDALPMFMESYESLTAQGAKDACREDLRDSREITDMIVIEGDHFVWA